jgi:hypothetical protein
MTCLSLRLYSQVSATFAASLVTSPALGAYLGRVYSETLVVAIATAVAILDVFFILVAVPESLPEKVRPSSWGAPISWEQADPFAVSLRHISYVLKASFISVSEKEVVKCWIVLILPVVFYVSSFA